MKLETYNSDDELFIRYNNLRGYLALVVLLSHIWGYTGLVFLVPFNKIVTIAVAMFFFLSGWGMTRSVSKKNHYLREIFMTKIPFLLWMAVLAYIFSVVLETFMIGSTGKSFLPFSFYSFLKSTNWYVWELIGFYLLFSVCVRWIQKKYWLLVIGIVSAVAFVVFFYTGVVEAYYNSIVGFGLGMFFGDMDIKKFMKKYKMIHVFGILILLVSFGCMFVLNHESIFFAVVRNIAAVGGILLVMWALQYVNPMDKLSKWLSRISPELYFYHMPIALILFNIEMSVEAYVFIVIVASFAVAIIVNILDKWVQNNLKKHTCDK